jgi:hypothetical protein
LRGGETKARKVKETHKGEHSMNNLAPNALLEYVKSEGRICPMPPEWNTLWEMLPDRKRSGGGWEPSAPLILAAWYSPALFKQLRLAEHIRYATEHDALEQVDTYLRSLTNDQWLFVDTN